MNNPYFTKYEQSRVAYLEDRAFYTGAFEEGIEKGTETIEKGIEMLMKNLY